MKLLVFGKTGQVARELAQRCPADVEPTFLDRAQADLADPDDCAAAIRMASPDLVINAAAWTDVDAAEDDEERATIINAAAPGRMAEACEKLSIPFLHLSSDYVFGGSGSVPFVPNDQTAPLGAYGRSKLAGESLIRASSARFLILRTSWVFSAHGSNFVRTMLRLGRESEKLSVVCDQIGSPTPAADLADALYSAARQMRDGHVGGIHHFAGAPDMSWADFARAIMREAGLDCEIEDIPSSGYPSRAARPNNSRLDCSSFESAFGVSRPDWREGLKSVLAELRDA